MEFLSLAFELLHSPFRGKLAVSFMGLQPASSSLDEKTVLPGGGEPDARRLPRHGQFGPQMFLGKQSVGKENDIKPSASKRAFKIIVGIVAWTDQNRHSRILVDCSVRHPVKREIQIVGHGVNVPAVIEVREVARNATFHAKQMLLPVELYCSSSRDLTTNGQDHEISTRGQSDRMGHLASFNGCIKAQRVELFKTFLRLT